MTLRLPDDRSVDQVHFGRSPSLDVLEHRGIVRASAFGGEDVHLPGIVAQLDTCCRSDELAFVDESVDEMAEIGLDVLGSEVCIVGKTGHGSDTGHRRVDGHVEVRQLAWIRRRGHPRGEVVPAADPEPSIVQRLRMLLPAREHEHVCNLREMRGEETADRARTDDAYPHANFVCRYFRYGSGSMPEPVTRRSRSGGADRPPWRENLPVQPPLP